MTRPGIPPTSNTWIFPQGPKIPPQDTWIPLRNSQIESLLCTPIPPSGPPGSFPLPQDPLDPFPSPGTPGFPPGTPGILPQEHLTPPHPLFPPQLSYIAEDENGKIVGYVLAKM